MAVTPTPIYPQVINTPVQQILPADTTTLKTLYTAGANGSRIDNINVASTDTAARDLGFYVTVAGTDYLLFTLACPLNSGNTNAINPLAVFAHVVFQGFNFDPNGNRYINLATGAVLKVKALTTVTAAKAIQFFVQGGDY